MPVHAEGPWSSLIERYWPADAWALAERIEFCESSDIPTNSNGTSWGLFAINWPYHRDKFSDPNELWDPETNIRIAADLYRDQGSGPWVASEACWGMR